MSIQRILLLLLPLSILHAQPKEMRVANGSASCKKDGSSLTVHASDCAILDWKSFSISKGETTKFVLPSDQSKALNRVVGSSKSLLMGKLVSNGTLYLINQNGILIGPNAVIDTKSALFSTLDLSNNDFL
jgi:filamentous hemagglutinin family protein